MHLIKSEDNLCMKQGRFNFLVVYFIRFVLITAKRL